MPRGGDECSGYAPEGINKQMVCHGGGHECRGYTQENVMSAVDMPQRES